MSETMREAMDRVRPDTDDATGATSPVPTDEELTAAVAILAAQAPPAVRRTGPGWVVVAVLAAFILLADVGILVALRAQERAAGAACERVNALRAANARVLVAQEASVPAERYDAATRAFYDQALTDLSSPVNCIHPDRREVKMIERMPRELGQPPPVVVPGAGTTGAAGTQGVAGLAGRDGPPGAAGPAGERGAAGRDGVDGRNGAAGVPGSPGMAGAPGVPGPPGPEGPPAPPTTLPPMTTLPPTTTTTRCPNLLGLGCPPP